jgi:hypothetical protein
MQQKLQKWIDDLRFNLLRAYFSFEPAGILGLSGWAL